MSEWINKNFLCPITPRWLLEISVSVFLAALIVIFKPLGLNFSQSATVAGLVLVVIWWTVGTVKKIPASLFLLGWFCVFSGAPKAVIFTFPLSETFIMLIVTYIFSRAISNCGMIDKTLLPILIKYCNTPLKLILATVGAMFATIYIIPQPVARILLVAVVLDSFLKRTSVPKGAYSVFMYGIFVFYSAVNIGWRDGDIIMNMMAASSGAKFISNWEWVKIMFIPTLGYLALIIAVFMVVFRKELKGVKIELLPDAEAVETRFIGKDLYSLWIILITVFLWATSSLWGNGILLFGYITPSTAVTAIATVLLFIIGGLKHKDLFAVDVVTMTFLAAAFSIGGVMKACGAAEIIFGKFESLFPKEFSVGYLFLMMLVAMLLHMLLGSITTTISVVIPGLTLICQSVVPPQIIVFAAVLGTSYHAILPFHSVTLMLGASNGYFPSSFIPRLGIASTPFVFLAAAFIYLPYWRLIGLV